jgi:hypothetical protein
MTIRSESNNERSNQELCAMLVERIVPASMNAPLLHEPANDRASVLRQCHGSAAVTGREATC